MSFSKMATFVAGAAMVSRVAAHGHVQGIVADGVYYEGYSASMQYTSPPPDVVGWSTPDDLSNGFVAPDAYATADIICHLGATNAPIYANVTAGNTVELQWTAWPESHHGPVLDYLASCNGDCATVDKTALEFFKIDGVGLIDDTSVPGTWASDQLIANNNSWSVTIPSTLAPGAYVLRHEIIALHSAGTSDGAQNYPQCVNLWVSGSGSATPATAETTAGEALYSENDTGIIVNIYASLASYDIPGPTQWASATASVSQGATAAGGAVATGAASVASSSSSVATTSAVASSSIAVAASSNNVAAAVPTSSSSAKVSCSKKSSSVAAVAATSNNVAAVAPTSASSSKVSCSKKSSAVAVVTAAPTTITSNGNVIVVTEQVTNTLWTTDIVYATVTAGAKARRHARDVRA